MNIRWLLLVNRYGLLEKYLYLSDINALIAIKGEEKAMSRKALRVVFRFLHLRLLFLFSKYQEFWKS